VPAAAAARASGAAPAPAATPASGPAQASGPAAGPRPAPGPAPPDGSPAAPPPPGADRLRFGDLRLRLVSAFVLGPLCLACIWLGALPGAAMLGFGMAGLAAEWVHLCGARLRALPGLAVPVIVCAACAAAADHAAWGLLLLLAGGAAVGMPVRRGSLRHLGWGVLYVGLAGIALVWLRGADAAGRGNVLFLVLVVWASDIGAYLAGRLIGGARLAPSISPAKTWSGAAGGLLAAVLIGLAAASLSGRAPAPAAALALLLGVAAQGGDLLESLLKRRFGVKDSGTLIPGHGGLLDRVDGLLAAAPAAALVAWMLGRGDFLWH
jgi:phosphatidate cytidylyltransferase